MSASGRLVLGLSLVSLLLPAGASSQTVLGTVTDADDARPLDVALARLLDADGRPVASALTDEAGRFRLRAPAPGSYRLVVERIGYADIRSGPHELRRAGTVRLALTATPRAVPLDGIEVEGDARCRVRPTDGRLTAQLWDEARKALAVTTWAQEARVLRFRTVRWRRALDPETLRVLEERRVPGTGYHSGSPYESLPAAELQEGGWIREVDGGELEYHAPDPAALLSDAFLDAHCFVARVHDPPEPGWVGLDFRPLREDRVPDIRGTFWLDATTAELKRVEYRYTRLPADLASDRPGGTLELDRLPRGPWIVRRWAIRTPVVGIRERASLGPTPGGRVVYLAGLNETGGEVVGIRTPDGSPLLQAESATLAGTVWDSVADAPLVRATVRLDGTDERAVTDGFGRFRLVGLPAGRYAVTFEHPRLGTLAWTPDPVPVELVVGDTAEVALALPPTARILGGACAVTVEANPVERAAGVERPGTAVVVGRAAPGAEILLSWEAGRARDRGAAGGDAVQVERVGRAVRVTPGDDGVFRVCGLPAEEEITLTVERDGAPTGDAARVTLDPGEIRRIDLDAETRPPGAADATGSRGRADVPVVRLAPAAPGPDGLSDTAAFRVAAYATVRDAETAEPLTDVSVRLDDGPWIATGTGGRAALGRVAPGAHRLELRHVLFGSWSDTVTVEVARAHHWMVDVVPRPIELEGVDVTVTRSRDAFDLFEPGVRVDRMTRADVDARLEKGATDVTDLMLSPELPFLTIRHVTFEEFGNARVEVPGVCVELARKRTAPGQCAMVAVFIDDVPLHHPHLNLFVINPHGIESIEVLQPDDAAFRFGPIVGANGAILIYTRRGPGDG